MPVISVPILLRLSGFVKYFCASSLLKIKTLSFVALPPFVLLMILSAVFNKEGTSFFKKSMILKY